jgi:hypothetical protein
LPRPICHDVAACHARRDLMFAVEDAVKKADEERRKQLEQVEQ